MIVSSMSKQEVNYEIVRVFPDLMKLVFSKTKHRARQARKHGYPEEVSNYDVYGVKFSVYYFFDSGADLNTIFCRYQDNKGLVYAYVTVYAPGQYSILHFLKHAVDQYNSRLKLGFDNISDVLFHMAKQGLIMTRQDVTTNDKEWLDVGWKCQSGLWLGESMSKIIDSNTHVSVVRTFIDDSLVRPDQEGVLDDDTLEKLIVFEQEIGGDAYARRRVTQLLDLFTTNK